MAIDNYKSGRCQCSGTPCCEPWRRDPVL